MSPSPTLANVPSPKDKLGAKGMWREVIESDGSYELREAATAYNDDLGLGNKGLRQKNSFIWDLSL